MNILRRGTGLEDHFDTEDTLQFPGKLALGGASYAEGVFGVTWRERATRLVKEEKEDLPPAKIRGDWYEFHAFRRAPVRAVMRFEYLPRRHRAALFIQLPLLRHDGLKAEAMKLLEPFVPATSLTRINIGRAIAKLDEAELAAQNAGKQFPFQSQQARFGDRGASVEFAASAALPGWKSIASVRRVRAAMTGGAFAAATARFRVSLAAGGGATRRVMVSLDATQARAWVRSQLARDQMWSLLDDIWKHA